MILFSAVSSVNIISYFPIPFFIFFYFFLHVFDFFTSVFFFFSSPSHGSPIQQWTRHGMHDSRRGWCIKSLGDLKCYKSARPRIESLFRCVSCGCHHFFLNKSINNGIEEQTQASMNKHNDQCTVFRLILFFRSQKSYLEWTRREDSFKLEYEGPSWQIVGLLNSGFFDFDAVFHHSVNCDFENMREVVVFSFSLDPTETLHMNATTIAQFLDIIKNLQCDE